MNQPTHRDTEAFLSRACGQGKHYACAKLNCTCNCHQSVTQTLVAMLDDQNLTYVLEVLGLPIYDDG